MNIKQILINNIPIFLFFIFLLISLFGLFGGSLFSSNNSVAPERLGSPASANRPLIVLVHGMTPDKKRLDALVEALEPYGEVLRLNYNASLISNADPTAIAQNISNEMDKAIPSGSLIPVIMVAHSMGAPLTRRAILIGKNQHWVEQVNRVVLMAGVARGWDLSGEPPPDSNIIHRYQMRFGYWLANMFGCSKLPLSFERGSPFIADLRIEWMRWIQEGHSKKAQRPNVVQMLGDIDDIVSREDNEDLKTMANGKFAQMRIRGTGHGDIVDIGTDAEVGSERQRLGQYRLEKLVAAITLPFDEVKMYNEELPSAVDPSVNEVVFVLHGIRDLGRWSSEFESEITHMYPTQRRANLRIISPRYGYFGMGPFLFESVRDRYARWLMDEYTETLARYPNLQANGIHFFGHSNGTYLLTRALELYKSMEINNVVFAGSVVPKNYNWAQFAGRVQRVRNYVGTEDWVVALFPRLFELPIIAGFGNHIGSAGFNGFDQEKTTNWVENVFYVDGAHGAFEGRVREIVDYLLNPGTDVPAREDQREKLGKVLESTPVVLAVWSAIVAALLFVGIRVVAAAPSPSWPFLLLYLLLVVQVLKYY